MIDATENSVETYTHYLIDFTTKYTFKDFDITYKLGIISSGM